MATLIAVYNSEGCVGRCDAKCYAATGGDCQCICQGKNHAVGVNRAVENTRELAEAWVEAYLAEHPSAHVDVMPRGVQLELDFDAPAAGDVAGDDTQHLGEITHVPEKAAEAVPEVCPVDNDRPAPFRGRNRAAARNHQPTGKRVGQRRKPAREATDEKAARSNAAAGAKSNQRRNERK